MTATEAARGFSDVLNRVAGGEEVEVIRSGAPVALITPPRVHLLSAERFRDLLATAPRPDADFGEALRALRAGVPAPEDRWAS